MGTIQVEEYDFEITRFAGHTEYQMALFVTIDGAAWLLRGCFLLSGLG